MHKQAISRLITYDRYELGQNSTAVKIGELKYSAKESERRATPEGFNRKIATQAKMNAKIGPKNLCVCPNASK